MSRLVFEAPAVPLSGSASRDGASSASPRRHQPLPVIVGCPRSGTSLLAVMLDSHPDLAVPPETAFIGLVAGLHGESATVRQGFFDVVTADRLTVSNWPD